MIGSSLRFIRMKASREQTQSTAMASSRWWPILKCSTWCSGRYSEGNQDVIATTGYAFSRERSAAGNAAGYMAPRSGIPMTRTGALSGSAIISLIKYGVAKLLTLTRRNLSRCSFLPSISWYPSGLKSERISNWLGKRCMEQRHLKAVKLSYRKLWNLLFRKYRYSGCSAAFWYSVCIVRSFHSIIFGVKSSYRKISILPTRKALIISS